VFGKKSLGTKEREMLVVSWIFGPCSILSILCLLISGCVVYAWFVTRNWVLNNLLGASLAITFMKTL
jgi:presenilin-like A22 family membrane protease